MKLIKILLFLPMLYTITLSAKTENSTIVDKIQYHILNKIPKNLKIYTKKGDYTTGNFSDNKKEIRWIENFNIVELGDINSNNINHKFMTKNGFSHIKYRIGYDWMPAFYYYINGNNRKFIKWLYNNKKQTTLNPNGPYPHCKDNNYSWCKDFYYNWGNQKVLSKRVQDLILNMEEKGFNGLFFDWASGGFITDNKYQTMKKNFERLNPKKNYFKLVGKFYKTLKKRGILIVTNQAFRKNKYLLKYTTYDMTESYITTDIDKNIKIQIKNKGWVNHIKITDYYPIYKNSKTIKDSLYFINLLTSYKKKYKKYGLKNFIYMNYLAPKYKKIYKSLNLYEMIKPKNAIYFSYAMAKLTNNFVYAEIPENRQLERDNIYFYDLGHPFEKSYEKLDAIDGYIRFYTNGFVLVSKKYKKEKYIKLYSKYIKSHKILIDTYNHIFLKSSEHSIVIKLDYEKDTFSSDYLPLGRVFLYTHH